MKLNHCLGESGTTEFDALLQLSADGNSFTITNKVLLRNAHVITADNSLIEIQKKKFKE